MTTEKNSTNELAVPTEETKRENPIARFLNSTELDTRMLGMVAALLVVWCVFDVWSGILRPNEGLLGGAFLTPRNLWTLLVQTSSIAVMATGMVLVIVMRHIDFAAKHGFNGVLVEGWNIVTQDKELLASIAELEPDDLWIKRGINSGLSEGFHQHEEA